MTPVPKNLQPFLPSSPVEALDAKSDARYIIENLLKKSDLNGWRWLLKTYPQETITHVVKSSPHLKPKEVMFWRYYYQLPADSITCLQPKSPKTPASSWAY